MVGRHTAATGGRCIVRQLVNGGFGREHEPGDRSGVLERCACDLCRINDAGLDHVFVGLGLRVVAEGGVLALANFLANNGAFLSGVLSDPTQRLFERAANNLYAQVFVSVGELETFENGGCANKSHAAAGHDAFFDGCTGCVHGVFDTGLLLFHFGLGRCTDFDDGHAADEFR